VAKNGKTAVLMDARPPMEDTNKFETMQKKFTAIGMTVPEIYATDHAHGLVLMEDFGDERYYELVTSGKEDVNKLYGVAVDALVHKYFAGSAPTVWAPQSIRDSAAREGLDALIAAAAAAAEEVPRAYEELRLNDALTHVWSVIERANEFTDRAKPWESGKDEARRDELGTVLSALLESLRLTAVWAWPAIPGHSETLWTMLGLAGKPGATRGADARPQFGAATAHPLGEAAILFPRIALEADARTS